MVALRGEVFTMGCTVEQSSYCRAFSIGKYEVTLNQWEAIIGINHTHFKVCSQCPLKV